MNLVAYGNENLLFNGNPKKTFFKATYQKYTNFGLQRFRIDYQGTKNLNEKTNTILEFKIERYAELLGDTYLVFTLPTVYSPIYHYATEEGPTVTNKNGHEFAPYEFKWIDNYHSLNLFQDDYCDFLDFIKNKVVIYEFSDEEDSDEEIQENISEIQMYHSDQMN